MLLQRDDSGNLCKNVGNNHQYQSSRSKVSRTDGCSSYICGKCLPRLNRTYEFWQFCKKNDARPRRTENNEEQQQHVEAHVEVIEPPDLVSDDSISSDETEYQNVGSQEFLNQSYFGASSSGSNILPSHIGAAGASGHVTNSRTDYRNSSRCGLFGPATDDDTDSDMSDYPDFENRLKRAFETDYTNQQGVEVQDFSDEYENDGIVLELTPISLHDNNDGADSSAAVGESEAPSAGSSAQSSTSVEERTISSLRRFTYEDRLEFNRQQRRAPERNPSQVVDLLAAAPSIAQDFDPNQPFRAPTIRAVEFSASDIVQQPRFMRSRAGIRRYISTRNDYRSSRLPTRARCEPILHTPNEGERELLGPKRPCAATSFNSPRSSMVTAGSSDFSGGHFGTFNSRTPSLREHYEQILNSNLGPQESEPMDGEQSSSATQDQSSSATQDQSTSGTRVSMLANREEATAPMEVQEMLPTEEAVSQNDESDDFADDIADPYNELD